MIYLFEQLNLILYYDKYNKYSSNIFQFNNPRWNNYIKQETAHYYFKKYLQSTKEL